MTVNAIIGFFFGEKKRATSEKGRSSRAASLFNNGTGGDLGWGGQNYFGKTVPKWEN